MSSIDDGFHRGQMRRQRPAVMATAWRAGFSILRRLFGGLGEAGRLDLFGLVEPELELSQRQALGPAAEAMAL